MKRTLKWIALHGLFAAALIAAYLYSVDGAKNFVWFYTMTHLVGALVIKKSDLIETFAKIKKPSVPRSLDALFDVSAVLFLVWNSVWIPAIAYALSSTYYAALWDDSRKLLPETEAAQ